MIFVWKCFFPSSQEKLKWIVENGGWNLSSLSKTTLENSVSLPFKTHLKESN